MFTFLKVLLAGTCLFGSAGAAYAPNQAVNNATGPLHMTQKQGYIGEDEAKNVALKDAGVKEKETTYLTVHLDTDDGMEVYEVEFMVGNKEFDYDIDAYTGQIVSKDFDIEGNNGGTTTKGTVTQDQAKEIAVKDAGFAMTDVSFTKVKQEYDDGFHKIKVEFVCNGVEYEYDIDAGTGKILKTSTDTVNDDFDDYDVDFND